MIRLDWFTGTARQYDATTDVDEYILCSLPASPHRPMIGHSCHTDIREAKKAQIALFLDHDIDAWIEHIKPFGPPGIEEQLDAAIYECKQEYLQ